MKRPAVGNVCLCFIIVSALVPVFVLWGCGTPDPPAGASPDPMAWTVGTWHGTRTAADDGRTDSMTVRVEPLPSGTGQLECLQVWLEGAPYTGFTLRAPDAENGSWTMVYVNSSRRTFARLVATFEGTTSTWRSVTPGRKRESKLVAERTDTDHWRKTQYTSEDGGTTWRVLFTDELERDGD